MGFVATESDLNSLNFNFDLVDYARTNNFEILTPPTPPPMPPLLWHISLAIEDLGNDDFEISPPVAPPMPPLLWHISLPLEEPIEEQQNKEDQNDQIIENDSIQGPSENINLELVEFSEALINAEVPEELECYTPEPVEIDEPCYFDLLPMEMVIHIFKFLNLSDRQKVCLVSRRFLSACLYKKLNKNAMLSFVDTFYEEFTCQISQFANTLLVYPIISLNTGNFDVASQTFWVEYGGNIREVYFRNGIMRKAEFEECVRWTPHLEVLKIEGNNLFRTWDIRGTYHERLIQFVNCRHISLARNTFLNRKVFDYITATAPNLSELDLSNCMNKIQTMSGSERTTFLDHVIFFLKQYGEQMKLLNFSNTVLDDFFLQQISEIPKLKLRSLSITFNGCINNKKFGLLPLIRSQTEMEHFDISDSPAVEETVLIEICKHMKKLKDLNLKKCVHITNYCIRELVKLPHLEVLNINGCEYITIEGLEDGLIKGTPKLKLRELNFGSLPNLCEHILIKLSVKYDNQITVLDLGGSGLTDMGLQVIIKHFRGLRHLNVESNCKLSDYGFTGKNPDNGRQYFSIRTLKGLRSLRCSNCFKITDFSLIDSFQFLELRELYFSRSHITEKGISAMVKTCPSLEVLDLTECDGVYDSTLAIITQKLHRLKTLKLNGCWNLTELSFDHIYNNCQDIRNLYLRNCENVHTEKVKDQLYYMRTLRKVYLE